MGATKQKQGVQVEQRVQILTDLIRAVLVDPPAVTACGRDLIVEEFSIGVHLFARPKIGGTVKGNSFQVYNPVGEEVGLETSDFNTAAKQLVTALAYERMQRLLDDMATEALAREWQ